MEPTRFLARPNQPLFEHLKNTALLAGRHGAAFGVEDAAYLCGLLHDFGKYSGKFQQVLRGELHHVDHTAAGAYLACIQNGRRINVVGRCIFSHHAELFQISYNEIETAVRDKDAVSPHAGKLIYSIQSDTEFQDAYAFFCRELRSYFPKKRPVFPNFSAEDTPALNEMLFQRFLLSCLVDADYTDAAGEAAAFAEEPLEPEIHLKQLCDYLQDIRARSTGSKEINRLRDRVFEDCCAAADSAPGIFSLTAPTGLGKTLSMLAFALKHAAVNGLRRIIIVLPYLSIIEQNAAVYRNIYPNLLEDHSQSNLSDQQRQYAERYSAPVIVTTSVKFFESLFRCRSTDCRRLHNIANSVILFDEAQSLPTNLTAATLASMRELCARYGASVVFSTATQPSFDIRKDVKWQPREIIRDPEFLFCRTRRANVEWNLNKPTPFETIAEDLCKATNCCAIVNTKAQALSLYEALAKRCDRDSCQYLTTDLCPAHREAVLKSIRALQAQNKPCRVVSTQCIEAGVDISFQTMYRALAPLTSIVQSAGRVNRNGVEEAGRLVVFLPEGDRLYPDASYENAAVAVRTLLSRHGGNIDLQSLSDMHEYYALLFGDPLASEDKRALTNAIQSYDYAEVAKQYRLIDAEGVSIIVPYPGKEALFDEITSEALKTGITPQLMKLAAPITVHSYNKKAALETCVRFNFPSRPGQPSEPSDWYFTDASIGLYDAKIGLRLGKLSNLNAIY